MKPVLSTEEVVRLEDIIEREGTSKAELMELAGEFAANRGEQARIIASVSDADKPSVRKWLESGLAKGRGKFPTELQWKPLKKGDLPFVRIEPADPQYAFGPFSK